MVINGFAILGIANSCTYMMSAPTEVGANEFLLLVLFGVAPLEWQSRGYAVFSHKPCKQQSALHLDHLLARHQ